jgi:endonuclease/exonuclease/phosphatase family metal-dependent hydrolase
LGDFNIIYQAADKNNLNLNLRLRGLFRNVLNDCLLKEIPLQNRKFTWSNEREAPTLVQLDRVFSSTDWDVLFDNQTLNVMSSSLSDHCPLLLSNTSGPP